MGVEKKKKKKKVGAANTLEHESSAMMEELQVLRAENEALHKKLKAAQTSTQTPSKSKSTWKSLMKTLKGGTSSSTSTPMGPERGGEVESKMPETPSSRAPSTDSASPALVALDTVRQVSKEVPAEAMPPPVDAAPPPVGSAEPAPKAEAKPETATPETAVPPPAVTVSSGGSGRGGDVAAMFAGRGGGGAAAGRGGDVAAMFAGRGGGGAAAGRGGDMGAMFAGRGGGGAAAGRGGDVAAMFAGRGGPGRGDAGGRGAGLAAMFAGRGGGGLPGTAPTSSTAGGKLYVSVLIPLSYTRPTVTVDTKLAVRSTRPIPIPPLLPGMVAAGASGAPGGPPPMPGSVATSNDSGLPPKPKIIPKLKLKGLFWTKIKPAEAKQTVWEDIQEPQVPADDIEASFADESALKKTSTSVSEAPKKAAPKFVSLFDGRRTQNVAIACGKLRMDPKAIYTLIVELDFEKLTADVTETLVPLVPTAEESNLIRSYDGNVADLDAPGKLFKVLVDIPRLEQRLKIHSIILSWEDDADLFADDLDIVVNTVAEFQAPACQQSLVHFLALILAIGNYLNGGTARGQAYGLKLDALVKLVNIKKTSSNKETLMHFLVEHYEKIFPDEEMFFESWLSTWKAPKINMKQLEGDLKALEASVQQAKAELKASADIADDDIRLPLKNNLIAFIQTSEERLVLLQQNFAETQKGCETVRKFYGDKSSGSGEEDPNSSFFELMTKFASMIKKSLEDMVQWEEAVSENASIHLLHD